MKSEAIKKFPSTEGGGRNRRGVANQKSFQTKKRKVEKRFSTFSNTFCLGLEFVINAYSETDNRINIQVISYHANR
jgi:hypothetical protein